MKMKQIVTCIFAWLLVLQACGCGGILKEEISRQEIKSPVLYWGGVTDIFDPMGYAEQGFFEMTMDEIISRCPESMLCWYWSTNGAESISLENVWLVGDLGIEYTKAFFFKNGEVDAITYGYMFYNENMAKEYFLQLCERMSEITDTPRWEGIWESSNAYSSQDLMELYREVPFTEVEESLKNNDAVSRYEYVIDMENEHYTESMKRMGYKPFDPNSIKADARWIPGLSDAKVIRIWYMKNSGEVLPEQIKSALLLRVER